MNSRQRCNIGHVSHVPKGQESREEAHPGGAEGDGASEDGLCLGVRGGLPALAAPEDGLDDGGGPGGLEPGLEGVPGEEAPAAGLAQGLPCRIAKGTTNGETWKRRRM